jgi:hypothetical protein
VISTEESLTLSLEELPLVISVPLKALDLDCLE